MGYLYLTLALCFGLIKAYCGKRSSSVASSPYNAILINTVRMTICVLFGAIIVLISGISSFMDTSHELILIALLSGVGSAAFTVSWLMAVNTNAYMIVEVFIMGGTIIPLTLSSILYHEKIETIQVIGILILLVAVYCMCTYRSREKIKLSLRSLLILLLCAISSGFADFSQKLYIRQITNASISLFNLYTYIFAAITLFIIFLFIRVKAKEREKLTPAKKIVRPIIHYVVIMAICLFLNFYFKTNAAGHLDAILLYPLNQGCAVVLSLLMSVVLFKEKTTLKGIVGIALSLVAMILINISI